MRWCVLLLLVIPVPVFAGNPPGYRTYYPSYQKVYYAESVLVPVVVPSTLLINLTSAVPPPPVTIAPQALLEAQNANTAVLSRMEVLERKLDLLLGQQGGTMLRAEDTRPALAQVASLTKMMCAQCHSGTAARGGVVLFNNQGAYQPNIPPSVIVAAVRDDRMPRSPNKLSIEQKALLEAWIKP